MAGVRRAGLTSPRLTLREPPIFCRTETARSGRSAFARRPRSTCGPPSSAGQNFVIDPNTVRRIVRDSGIGPDDVVLEVGPGLGSLTLALLDVAARVVAIEVDPVLAAALPGDDRGPRARRRPTGSRWWLPTRCASPPCPGPPPTALVANLPYNVSVPVLLHLLALLPSLERGLVMVQSEVADRLAAAPGSKVYGIPSVKAAWFADVRRAGCDRAQRLLAGAQRRLRPGRLDPPRAADDRRHARAGLRRRRRRVRPAAQGAAPVAARARRLGRGLRARARRRRDRPDDARRAAAARRLRADRGGPGMTRPG